MGQAALAVIANPISDCAKYVCNSCHVKSKCSECCELDVDTDQISVKSKSSDEISADCCGNHVHGKA